MHCAHGVRRLGLAPDGSLGGDAADEEGEWSATYKLMLLAWQRDMDVSAEDLDLREEEWCL